MHECRDVCGAGHHAVLVLGSTASRLGQWVPIRDTLCHGQLFKRKVARNTEHKRGKGGIIGTESQNLVAGCSWAAAWTSSRSRDLAMAVKQRKPSRVRSVVHYHHNIRALAKASRNMVSNCKRCEA